MPIQTVQMFNFLHLLFLGVLVFSSLTAYFLCLRFGKEFARRFCLVLIWGNFAIHFLKQLSPSYIAEWPTGLIRSTPENLCALLITVSPFVYLSKNRYLKDYLVVVGLVSGVMAILIPTVPTGLGEKIQQSEGLLESIRYFACHVPLVLVGILSIAFDIHRPDYRRLWALPLLFMAAFLIIFLDDLVMAGIGLLKPEPFYQLFSRDFYNPSLVFGVTSNWDKVFSWAYYWLIPFLYHLPNGELAFVPVIWPLLALYFAVYPLFFLAYMPFQHKRMKEDFLALRARFKEKRASSKGKDS